MLDLTPDERRRDAVALAAVTPTLVAGLWRAANGLEPIAPRDGPHGAAGCTCGSCTASNPIRSPSGRSSSTSC
ncbi:MAG: hypothetical protein R2690_20840 [Acidimicrobiales bacterium]